jgi:pimeloyl-ACP methyl ester carboxylesterase
MIHRRTLFAIFGMLFAAMLMPAPAAAKAFASTRITITVEGKGPNVILIPGHSSSPRVWREMIAAVPGYRYHKVQVHGFAGTDKSGNSEGNVAAPVAEEIARYVAEQKLGPVTVIGHSMGGTISLMLAARHPADVAKLMVVDMMPFVGAMFGGPDATPATVQPIADQIMAGILNSPPDAYAKQLEGTITNMIDTPAMRPGALEDAQKTDRGVAARALGELVTTDLRPELSHVTAKAMVLYITPKGAPLTDAQIDAFYQASYANLKGVTFKRVPNAAHFIMWDNAPLFQAEVRAFLAA